MPVRQLDLDFREGLRRLSLSDNLSGTEPTFARGEKSIGDAGSWREINDGSPKLSRRRS
jgi:hypothetical protein